MQAGYSVENPFTNAAHAADVVQCCHLILSSAHLSSVGPLEELAVLVAAMIHDFKVCVCVCACLGLFVSLRVSVFVCVCVCVCAGPPCCTRCWGAFAC